MKNKLLSLLLLFLLPLVGSALAPPTPPSTGRPLAEALNPDGTLRAGANGSFDARQFTMRTAPDGRPVFSPTGTTGAGDERWADGFGVPNGTDGQVLAVVRSGTDIYIGGYFTIVGSVMASNVARWNGTTWSALGTGPANGVSGIVYALAVASTGEVYAGGSLTAAGGTSVNNVARWNGTAWSPLSTGTANGTDNSVYALAVASNGTLYVGGAFATAGGVATDHIAQWNGTAWSPLGTGTDGNVNALAVASNGDVYVGGGFAVAGSVYGTRFIAKWNATGWSAMGNGFGGSVRAIALASDGSVYANSFFVYSNNLVVNTVSKWNGTMWTRLDTGGFTSSTHGFIYSLAVAGNGDVYAGGSFTQVDGQPARNVARWNGTAWSALSTGAANDTNNPVYALAVAGNGDVYAGGSFAFAGGTVAYHIARWNGTTWSPVGPANATANGMDGVIYALAVAGNGDVYVGGSFAAAGGVEARNVARWNGTAWSSLGTGPANGVNDAVNALAVSSNGTVYVGGQFVAAGGVVANHVARWNGTSWSTLGTGFDDNSSYIYALAVAPSGDVYVGGNFLAAGGTAANNIARWNGTVWSSLGTGVSGSVNALAVAANGDLYAGGSFGTAGGGVVNSIARWNGIAWNGLGTGANNSIYALAVAANGDLYAGGYFTLIGGTAASRVARWNGTAWSSLSTGIVGTGTGANTLAVAANGDVYAGGYFATVGGAMATNIARWNGTAWSNLGTGTNGYVSVLGAGPNGKVYAGGVFSTTGDGSKFMSHFGIYDPNAPLATKASNAALAAQLFPNPAHGTATLRLPAGTPRQALALLDAQGRTVRRYPAPASADATLDLRGLPAGVYVVRCGELSQRLVVE